jgi:hypothetical protein
VQGLGSIDVWTCGAKVLEYWMISSLKIKLNCSWKFRRNWNLPLVLSEKSWQAVFNGIYLVRFGFRIWEILIFMWFLTAENSNKFQKTRFWKEKSVEEVVTLEPTAQATIVLTITSSPCTSQIVQISQWVAISQTKAPVGTHPPPHHKSLHLVASNLYPVWASLIYLGLAEPPS